jgi:lipopolysaccharide export LptBFGC system permease protein LptF
VSQLTERVGQADKEVQSRSAALQEATLQCQAQTESCARAQAACDVAAAAAGTAEKARDQILATLSRLKTVERWIEAKSEFNFRNAGAATCLVFALVGICLGILTRRGTVLVAVAVSFAAVLLVYYPLLMIGDTLADDGYLVPWIANWLADCVMGCMGLALLVWGVKR